MNLDEIIDLLHANPEITFEDARKQSMEAGISEKLFYGAWSTVHKGFYDKRVLQLMKLLDTTQTSNKAKQKAEAKRKGYLDDEFDLAYSLKEARIIKGPFPIWLTSILLIIFGIILTIIIVRQFNFDIFYEDNILALGIPLFGPALAYQVSIAAQKKRYFYKVLAMDFDATVLSASELNQVADQLETNLGSFYLKMTKGTFHRGLKLIYDKRPTYFLDYTYTIGSGDNKKTIAHMLVVQEHKFKFPHTLCYSKSTVVPVSILKSKVILEGTEFNRAFKVYVEDDNKKVDAFYVLNPRVMAKLLEFEPTKMLILFETVGNMVIIGSTQRNLVSVPFNTEDPVIPFDEYQNGKNEIMQRLDIATDVTDVLMREIVDRGDKRSIAKEF